MLHLLATVPALQCSVRRLQTMLCATQTISRQLYEVNGFRGAQQNYYDPDNSCINKVRLRRPQP